MSNLDAHPRESICGGIDPAGSPMTQLLEAREVPLGGPRAMRVRRTLPQRARSTVGAWCFLDHYGPDDVSVAGMRVPPHPHCGLQTVTWLVAGEVLHRDSLGNQALIRPGQLNLMTSGRGIAHSERTPPEHTAVLHGVQLWVALPDAARDVEPHFEQHADLPVVHLDGGSTLTVVVGELAGERSPARTYSPLVGAELALAAGSTASVDLDPTFEHAVLLLQGQASVLQGEFSVDGTPLQVSALLYLGLGRVDLTLAAAQGSRLLLVGGEPLHDELVMWWNFVARSHDEIATARQDWAAGRRFGAVPGDEGRLPAPALPTTRLKPRGRR